MSRVLIFGGTTEGRELAETLERSQIACDVCVATEYGAAVMRESPLIRLRQGRLDVAAMRALLEELRPDVVVDATHPYAELVTETIRASVEGFPTRYLRLLRPASSVDGCALHADMRECADALRSKQGRILLTTGSKELAPFCDDPELRKRVVVRVLPALESLRLCVAAGLQGRQIVAAQGPFSREMNEALMRQYDVRFLVAKESGSVGGEDARLDAARALGVEAHLIRRPQAREEDALDMAGTLLALEETLGVTLAAAPLDVVLAGVGCGAPEGMTEEARARIAESDYVFGAPRMLEHVRGRAVVFPFYRPEEILPELAKIRKERAGVMKVTILFSGDTGFFSGCAKTFAALRTLEGASTRILPGVSSVSALAARFGIPWSGAKIMSLHGVDESRWRATFRSEVLANERTFFITSGVADVRRVGEILANQKVRVLLGRSLSSPDEELFDLSPEECATVDGAGLWVGVVVTENPTPRPVVPTLSDAEFIRGKTPMTKEKARKIAICQMKLAPGQTIFDVGAGTGSVAIQAATLVPDARVYAIERDADAVELIRQNAAKFHADSLQIVHAAAPEGFEGLPAPDCAFIGGSGGRLDATLRALYAMNPEMRVVMNAVSLESVAEMNALVKRTPVTDLDVAQIAVDQIRRVGDYSMLAANNPVFVFSFNFRKE